MRPNILKFILLTTVVTSTFVSSMAPMFDNETEQVISPRDALFKTIKATSTMARTKTKYSYDNHTFYSQNDLNNYIFQTNKIETIETASNPGKIIQDYQYRTLDASKIYDTNFDNFQLVYRDAFGNVALTQQVALNTYTHAGLVKPRYSYDGKDWFDSPEEVKNGFVYKGGLRKSLYYDIDGYYYNVFNKDDQNKLLNSLTTGYHLKASKFTNYLDVYGTKESLKNIIQNSFETTWTSFSEIFPINYKNYLETVVSHKNYLSPGSRDMISVTHNGKTNNYYHGDTFVLDDIKNEKLVACKKEGF
ncbi:hypothetical protein [Spiroplasma endosymbiont of Ammophila pubescens]|uniref:hypothetical protein n=1 Tax=Spiroplasma endosymbiont of Ammophila pubescens TaxID=3066315 RepID=UPI0032B1695A